MGLDFRPEDFFDDEHLSYAASDAEIEASRQGFDTPMNRRRFLSLSSKVGFGMFAAATTYSSFLASCGRRIADVSAGGGGFGAAGSGGGDTINIGVISIYSGVGAFVGKLVKNGAVLAEDLINKHGPKIDKEGIFPDFKAYDAKKSPGVMGGKRIKLIQRDDNLSAQVAVSAVQEMITRYQIKGLMFCGLLDDIYACKQLVQKHNIPTIATYSDLFSAGQLFPDSDYSQVFQIFPPDIWAAEVLTDYGINDRGYDRFAYIGDATALGKQGRDQITKALAKHGKKLLRAEQYNVGDVDMTAQLVRIRESGCQCLVVWGLAGDTAHALQNLKKLGAEYLDHGRAQSSTAANWHPQIMGFPGGVAERTFAELSGDAARAGTVSTWYMGGVGYFPEFQGATEAFKKKWGRVPTGGENNPADSVYLLADAFDRANSTEPDKVIKALEEAKVNFFSTTPHSFQPGQRISLTKGDIIGVTLERGAAVKTSPAYELGTEFKKFHPPGYVGPTHFVRPNFDALMERHPELMQIILKEGYGTQCTKVDDPSVPWGFRLTPECKIH
ncbi:MAG TPA: ABC transporter substrate-binding protein [Actinomycetota bacterium]|nr:ABC transporter substrate-binding protein [Actinomycetota bacterium]